MIVTVTVTECQSQPVPAAGSGAARPVTGTFGRSLARALSLRLRLGVTQAGMPVARSDTVTPGAPGRRTQLRAATQAAGGTRQLILNDSDRDPSPAAACPEFRWQLAASQTQPG
jgi:hypothetical protein